MNQEKYELIIQCIKFGAPVLADGLIAALNATVQLANDRITELNQKTETENADKK